ncbi:fimbria/pilus outer membrane usher protein, partial [Shigella flexneri]
QDYWGNNEKNSNISVGVSGQQWGIGYSLNYQYSRYTDENNDRALSLNLSIPLERWWICPYISRHLLSLN